MQRRQLLTPKRAAFGCAAALAAGSIAHDCGARWVIPGWVALLVFLGVSVVGALVIARVVGKGRL